VQTHCDSFPKIPMTAHRKLWRRFVTSRLLQTATVRICYETGQGDSHHAGPHHSGRGAGQSGVNFDLANLILYGKANPVDATSARPYVQGIHAKDGLWPAESAGTRQEFPSVRVGEFPRIIARLKELNYRGRRHH